jgi:hypothetical protein
MFCKIFSPVTGYKNRLLKTGYINGITTIAMDMIKIEMNEKT